MATSNDPVTIVRDAYECFRQHDIDRLLQLVDEKCDWEVPGTPDMAWAGSYRGRDRVRRFFDKLEQSLETLEFKPEEFIRQDNTVIVMGHEKDRLKETGKTFETRWAHRFDVKNGKITFFRDYQDTAAIQAACH